MTNTDTKYTKSVLSHRPPNVVVCQRKFGDEAEPWVSHHHTGLGRVEIWKAVDFAGENKYWVVAIDSKWGYAHPENRDLLYEYEIDWAPSHKWLFAEARDGCVRHVKGKAYARVQRVIGQFKSFELATLYVEKLKNKVRGPVRPDFVIWARDHAVEE